MAYNDLRPGYYWVIIFGNKEIAYYEGFFWRYINWGDEADYTGQPEQIIEPV